MTIKTRSVFLKIRYINKIKKNERKKVQNILTNKNELENYCFSGVHVQEWEYLIENHECEINDVDNDGYSLLEILIQKIESNPLERDNIYETIEFLLHEYNIDPNLDHLYNHTFA